MKTDVTVEGKEVPIKVISATTENPPAQATTTTEEDLHTASQRHVNMIWEYTQSYIAVVTTTGALVGSFYFGTNGLPALMANAFFLIVGFYFGRTNHQKVGGVQLGR